MGVGRFKDVKVQGCEFCSEVTGQVKGLKRKSEFLEERIFFIL